MKLFPSVIFNMLLPGILCAQNVKTDSLESLLGKKLMQYSNRVSHLKGLSYEFQSEYFAALKLSGILKYKGEITTTRLLADYYYQRTGYPVALKYFNLNERLAARAGNSSALILQFEPLLNNKG